MKSRIVWALLCLFSCPNWHVSSAQTSTSDSEYYTGFCQEAASDPELFAQFRNHPSCKGIIETVSEEQGQEFCDFIKENAPGFLEYVEKFKEGDQVGNPKLSFYDGIGWISPTTLRYIKVCSDLEQHFGSLDGLSIIEIGGGYGGQCKIIQDRFNFRKYTIVDLPGPLLLGKRYLEAQEIGNVDFLSPDDPIGEESFDLVISNYAFSECTYAMQMQYIQDVLAKSKRGYMLCNLLVQNEYSAPAVLPRSEGLFANKQQVLKELRRASIPFVEFPEVPNTRSTNYLLLWIGK